MFSPLDCFCAAGLSNCCPSLPPCCCPSLSSYCFPSFSPCCCPGLSSCCFPSCPPHCCPSFPSCCCLSCCVGKRLQNRSCCTCMYLQFVKSMPGIIKICETLIGGLILRLLIKYGLNYNSFIGLAFEGSLTTTSACFLTSALLLLCYITSEKTFRTIRFTYFETVFNFVACLLHLSSAYFLYATIKAAPTVVQANVDVYSAMTIAYILSGIVGLIHGGDACMCYKYYKTGR